eukprot:CAMPEP_0116563450 /NCGR_PEP_ID=MMETSP0397-20121206/12741_1 /TAXON_ID=216820 /ORGANISM="Cyclophora tenuis, Strain ECT3854" /LENGTH=127 /DNA_ID=CAMNT_0004089897 /DNA_START=105 /DNA_END=488 /DNA_ORIENTATION=+
MMRTRSSVMTQATLSDAETMAVIQSAQDCADTECSVEDINAILSDLRSQERILTNRLAKVMNSVAKLQKVNKESGRSNDEVRSFVKDLTWVFRHDKPKIRPTGISFAKGPFDAYDVLEPKKWTPTEN